VNKISDKSHDNDGVVNSAVINCYTRRRVFPHLVEDGTSELENCIVSFLPYEIKTRKK
jgi:hypothetical protein